MSINIERMFADKDWTEEVYKPDSFGEFISGGQGRIFSNINYPGGQGPYPVIIICHGMPGNEKLADFAVILRHIGFCTLTFHYSGSWGSDGVFSLGNCLQDVNSVVEYVLANEKGLFDLKNIFLIGHSVGGLVGAYALAKHQELKAGALIMPANVGGIYLSACQSPQAYDYFRNMFDGFGEWLCGFSWNTLVQEMEDDAGKFLLTTYARQLSEKPMLAIAGAMDDILPRQEHIDLLTGAIGSTKRGKLQEKTFPTNHGISDQRNSIIRAIAEFFSLYTE